MTFKCLRSHVDSANIISMPNVNGTPDDLNFLDQDFKNHAVMGTTTKVKLLTAKFETLTDYQLALGTSDVASYDQDGNKVANPNFPFQLTFRPSADVNTLFPKDVMNGQYEVYETQLNDIKPNTTLFDVYGLDKPTEIGGKLIHMG